MDTSRALDLPVVDVEGLGFSHSRESTWQLSIERLQIEPGEHCYIFGPSGCGKTTLLQLIAGVHVPTKGTLRVLGEELYRGRRRDRRRAEHMGFVFQSFNLVPYLSAIENVTLPCRFAPGRRHRAVAQSGSLKEEAARLMLHLGLDSSHQDRKPGELSVGQQQRVAVARALIGRPPLIVCDEPTSALDPEARDQFIDLLLQECAEAGSTAIVVSHDPALRPAFQTAYDLAATAQSTVLRSAAA